MTTLALTPAEAAALADLPEQKVRKEVEHGLFGPQHPPRLDFPALVYLRALHLLGFELAVEDRKRLYATIVGSVESNPLAETVQMGRVVLLRLGQVVREVEANVRAFEAWKAKVVVNPNILGGEPVFPKSRLAIRHVGGMLERGVSRLEVHADYPYLTDEDMDFAVLYTRAYPKIGRPRAGHQAAG